MKVVGLLSGGAPVIKKYQVNATVANAGIPLLIGGAGEAGLDLPSTTALNDAVGVNLDTATYVTAQQTDGTSAERTVSVIINPDAILSARLSGGATTGTALTSQSVDTASTDGLAVTAGDYSTTTMDEGTIWCYSGANAGQKRKITSVSTTAATVTVAFDYDIAVGDQFLNANISVMDVPTPTLTSDFLEFDASAAAASNTAELAIIELLLRDAGDDGKNNSFALAILRDHVLNQGDA